MGEEWKIKKEKGNTIIHREKKREKEIKKKRKVESDK